MPVARPTMPDLAIDDPMALLTACHDKVRHFCGLLDRLGAHVLAQGSDITAQEAATAIRRYFEMAAPLHHDDEDIDLYPALVRRQPGLSELARQIGQEHTELNRQWTTVQAWLMKVQAGLVHAGAPLPPSLARFSQDTRRHADAEERLLYPHAQSLPATVQRQLADAMVQRRRQPTHPGRTSEEPSK